MANMFCYMSGRKGLHGLHSPCVKFQCKCPCTSWISQHAIGSKSELMSLKQHNFTEIHIHISHTFCQMKFEKHFRLFWWKWCNHKHEFSHFAHSLRLQEWIAATDLAKHHANTLFAILVSKTAFSVQAITICQTGSCICTLKLDCIFKKFLKWKLCILMWCIVNWTIQFLLQLHLEKFPEKHFWTFHFSALHGASLHAT